jgi:uncharacterized protein (DUF2235 family)
MKNILICCDGTGNEYGTNNTNVVQTYEVAVQDSGQICYYDPGVGTGGWEYNESTFELKAKADQATGKGLQKNVIDAYTYLMQTFEEGDRLYLFGFSRGAFTVRSLAGMLFKTGLLDRRSQNLVEYASKIYNTDGNQEVATGFKETFSRKCPVYFIGVWDTVESLVMNAGKKFHDARLNPEVTYGFHALAIDERRKDFPPFPWDESRALPEQTIEQLWFAGAHSDVGGFYSDRGLSNIAFHWMMKKAAMCGMKVDEEKLRTYQMNPNGTLHNSYRGFWKFRGSRTRKLPEMARIHESVKIRMDNLSNRYKPKNLPETYEIVSE